MHVSVVLFMLSVVGYVYTADTNPLITGTISSVKILLRIFGGANKTWSKVIKSVLIHRSRLQNSHKLHKICKLQLPSVKRIAVSLHQSVWGGRGVCEVEMVSLLFAVLCQLACFLFRPLSGSKDVEYWFSKLILLFYDELLPSLAWWLTLVVSAPRRMSQGITVSLRPAC